MPINDYLTGIDRFTSGEKQDVQTASQNLADLQTGAGSLPNKLKEALNEKLNYNKDIINQQSDVMQQYFAAPSAARAKYQDVWNPFEREKLVAQERTMALKPYDTLTGVLDQRMGDVADITTAGVQGWQGMVDAASTQLNAATTRLGTALQAYQIAGGQQSAADELALSVAQFNEANRQFNATMEMNKDQFGQQMTLEQQKLALSGRGSGGGGLSASQQQELTATERAAIAAIEKGIKSGDPNMKTGNDIRWSLMSAGLNPDDPKYSYLWSWSADKPTTSGSGWAGDIKNNAANWIAKNIGENPAVQGPVQSVDKQLKNWTTSLGNYLGNLPQTITKKWYGLD